MAGRQARPAGSQYIAPARAWRPVVVAGLARTLEVQTSW